MTFEAGRVGRRQSPSHNPTSVSLSNHQVRPQIEPLVRPWAFAAAIERAIAVLSLNAPELATADLSSLTRCTVGGQSMPQSFVHEVEARFGCPLLEAWGMTELAGIGTTNTALGPNRHGSIGVPIPYVSCRIADLADPTRTLPPDAVGELMVRGPIVMDGYFSNPDATRETIEPDGWLHTGDLARMDDEGFIYIVDRKKDLILSGGYNVYPAEIERVIAQHPAVAMVAVGSLPDQFKGEVAKAYVVCRDGASATEDEIMSLCREQLASDKLPRSVQFVDELPKTSTGKLLRRMLRTLETNTEWFSRRKIGRAE